MATDAETRFQNIKGEVYQEAIANEGDVNDYAIVTTAAYRAAIFAAEETDPKNALTLVQAADNELRRIEPNNEMQRDMMALQVQGLREAADSYSEQMIHNETLAQSGDYTDRFAHVEHDLPSASTATTLGHDDTAEMFERGREAYIANVQQSIQHGKATAVESYPELQGYYEHILPEATKRSLDLPKEERADYLKAVEIATLERLSQGQDIHPPSRTLEHQRQPTASAEAAA